MEMVMGRGNREDFGKIAVNRKCKLGNGTTMYILLSLTMRFPVLRVGYFEGH